MFLKYLNKVSDEPGTVLSENWRLGEERSYMLGDISSSRPGMIKAQTSHGRNRALDGKRFGSRVEQDPQ